jgi:hypothetical protein
MSGDSASEIPRYTLVVIALSRKGGDSGFQK